MNIEVKESNLELTFADTGCGIEDENKEKIFQRFYQSSKIRQIAEAAALGYILPPNI